MHGDGSPYFNTALIFDSQAFGNVTVGAASVAGGLVGAGDGTIAIQLASGNGDRRRQQRAGRVHRRAELRERARADRQSSASGAVTSTGPNSIVGGFAGLTGGTISTSSASGAGHRHQRQLSRRVRRRESRHDRASLRPPDGVRHRHRQSRRHRRLRRRQFRQHRRLLRGRQRHRRHQQRGRRLRRRQCPFVNFSAGVDLRARASPSGTITNSSATGTASGGPGSTVDPFIALERPDDSASNPPAFPSIVSGCTDPHMRVRQHRPCCRRRRRTPQRPASVCRRSRPNSWSRWRRSRRKSSKTSPARRSSRRSAPRRWSATSRAPSGCRRSRRLSRRPPAAATAVLPGLDRRVVDIPPLDRNPLHPGRGGGADRQQHDCRTAASRGQPASD